MLDDTESDIALRERTIELAALGLWAERKRHGARTGITGWREWGDEDARVRAAVRREVEAALVAVGAIASREPKWP